MPANYIARQSLLVIGLSMLTIGACKKDAPPDKMLCGANYDANGCLTSNFQGADLDNEVSTLDFERLEYEPPTNNIKGECQHMYVDFYYIPESEIKGIVMYYHGGGGDVGYLDNPEIINTCVTLNNLGYVVASIEYPRGWTDAEFCPERDPFTATPEEYQRETQSAALSVEHGRLGLEFALDHFDSKYSTQYRVYVSGNSFGGVMTAYMVLGDPVFVSDNRIDAGLVQFGGVIASDSVYPSVPVMLIDGVIDGRVPFDSGHGYGNPDAAVIDGCGGVYERIKDQVPALLIGTCDMGHGRGCVTEQEMWDIFWDFVQSADDGTWTNKVIFRTGDDCHEVAECV